MDGPQEETLELPGGRKQAPTLQVLEHHSIFFCCWLVMLVWWLVMVLVKKTRNPKSSVFFRITIFFWGDSLWCFFSREPDLNKTSPKNLPSEKCHWKSCPQIHETLTRCKWLHRNRDVDGYLEAPTNFEQRKKVAPGCLGLYRGCKTTHLCGNHSKPS